MWRALPIVLVVCACGKHPDGRIEGEPRKNPETTPVNIDPSPPDDCKRAVDNAIVPAKADGLAGEDRIKLRKQLEDAADVMLKTCRDMKWSKQMTDCMQSPRWLDCDQYLTQEQRDAWAKANVARLYTGSGAPAPPAPVVDDCKRVVDHMVELDNAGREALTGDERAKAEKQVAIVSEAMQKSCDETKWSKVMTDCMLAAKTFDEGEACGEHLTQEQKDAWAKAAMEAAMRGAEAKAQ